MAVPQVVDADLFDPGEPCGGLQRVVERVLREGEETIVFFDVVLHLHVLLELLGEEARQGNHPL